MSKIRLSLTGQSRAHVNESAGARIELVGNGDQGVLCHGTPGLMAPLILTLLLFQQ